MLARLAPGLERDRNGGASRLRARHAIAPAERSAGRERGHGAAARALFRDELAILADLAEDLGALPSGERGGCQRRNGLDILATYVSRIPALAKYSESEMKGDPDREIRAAAFEAIERVAIQNQGLIPWRSIARGFQFRDDQVHFASKALGIFKPRQMSAALSIRTGVPRKGRQSHYRDQLIRADSTSGLIHYDLASGKSSARDNRNLFEAYERGSPLIYFLGVEPALYEALWPVWIVKVNESEGRVFLAAPDTIDAEINSVEAVRREQQTREFEGGIERGSEPPNLMQINRTYSLVRAKRRNHQAWFSSRIKSVYGYKCALSGLPLRNLLVGAHILPDAEDGPAHVTNGICMSTLHHTAYDTNLIGIDPGCRVHVSRRVLASKDGPLLETLRTLNHQKIRLPADTRAHPNRDYLERRFTQYQMAN